jgi:glycyl-tRNA synthetase beta chain
MAEFFLELFSEEIPARMQKDAAGQLEGICAQVLKPLQISAVTTYCGPRRVALRAEAASGVPESTVAERGPRLNAPEQALAGFLRKHGADKKDLVQEGDFWVLHKRTPGQAAAAFILAGLAEALARFSWPKSMRWGQGGDFTWVRPLRRIVCLLDGEVIPITLGPVTASNETEGHRVHGPGPIAVSSFAVWEEKLREHKVIVDQAERRKTIAEGLAARAAGLGLSVAPDEGLLDEVSGLVEWPVPLIGRIGAEFMDLPPEVRELSMKVNQKYFALRDAAGNPAPYFAFVANLEAADGGTAIVAGNERVLRARLADARHFWDLDLKTPLDELLPKLEKITFHAKIGTQRQRAERIGALAQKIAKILRADAAAGQQAHWAGLLCKTDLVTGMVGEFPELQGVMGGYYAEATPKGWDGVMVGPAIKTHYQPKGPSDAMPTGTVAIAVALADKLDTLVAFFKIGEKPTGSGDPYALRRAALGVIRIILENKLSLTLQPLLDDAEGLFDFIIERLRVKLRSEGERFDILDSVLNAKVDEDNSTGDNTYDGNLEDIMQRVNAVRDFLSTTDGADLLTGYRRARSIVQKEQLKDNMLYNQEVDPALLGEQAEKSFFNGIKSVDVTLAELNSSFFNEAMRSKASDLNDVGVKFFRDRLKSLAALRPHIDAFFELKVNADEPELRHNRLRMLSQFVDRVNQIADFSRIEG